MYGEGLRRNVARIDVKPSGFSRKHRTRVSFRSSRTSRLTDRMYKITNEIDYRSYHRASPRHGCYGDLKLLKSIITNFVGFLNALQTRKKLKNENKQWKDKRL